MSLVKIIFYPKKNETHAIFKHITKKPLCTPIGYLNDKKEFVVTKYKELDETTDVVTFSRRRVKVSDTDKFDKYIGAAMVIAEESVGSKHKLQEEFEFYKQAMQSKVEWDALCTGLKQRSYYKNIEEYAYYVKMVKIFKSLERFRAYVDKRSVEKIDKKHKAK